MGSLKDELAKKLNVPVDQQSSLDAKKFAREAAKERAAAEHAAVASRYPGAEVLSLAQARELLAKVDPTTANEEIDGVFDPETFTLPSVQRVKEAMVVDEFRLPPSGSNLVVEGSLTVNGVLKQDFRAGGLLVLGDLVADHIVTTGEIACTGAMTVQGVLYGNCTNYGTNVWGRTRAKVVMSAKEHLFSFWGGQDVDVLIDVYGDTPNLDGRNYDGKTMGEILISDVGDGYDEDVVFRLLKERGTILRST